ncbi:MAG: GAF domain-containing protein, partial [Cyclobacteriaceae bacterium]
MKYNGKEVAFPAIMQISFKNVIENLEKQASSNDKLEAEYAQNFLKEINQFPELKTGIQSAEELDKYGDLIPRLSKRLFPESLKTNEIKALTPPFQFEPIYLSERFQKIISNSENTFSITMKDIDEDMFYLYCCYFILGSYYGYPVSGSGPMKMEIYDKNLGFNKTYKLLINADMTEFEPTNDAVEITLEDYHALMDNFGDLEIWKSKFPPNSWIMRGLNVLNLVDVTLDESITSITSNLLLKSNDIFDQVRSGICSLLQIPKLEIGILLFENDSLTTINQVDTQSILLDTGESVSCSSTMCPYAYEELLIKKEAFVISDIKRFHEKSQSVLSQRLADSEYGSYIIAPLIYEDELLGFIELGAKETSKLNKATLLVLDNVLPILAMAQKRFKTETQNLIEAIIQQECTTIHPSVKWRFEEEAEKFMNKQFNNERPVFKDIIFNNLYPLYAQLDIKGSSVRRNDAVSQDLIKQLSGVESILKLAFQQSKMPAYESLIFRLESFKKELEDGLSAGSEHKILSFLKTDIYPVFSHLKEINDELNPLIEKYELSLDPEIRSVYESRKTYDESVNLINQQLASYLDDKQIEAQNMFPHYFERYKTDGVEFNMYIGQSIVQNKKFDKIYLKNLRLWQLAVMCEMENVFKNIQLEISSPIEIASLILAYN